MLRIHSQVTVSHDETADVAFTLPQSSTTPLPSQQPNANIPATLGAVTTPYSTAADDGIYSVTIHYLDESNTELTAPTRRVFSAMKRGQLSRLLLLALA